jgi:hypothetical protein
MSTSGSGSGSRMTLRERRKVNGNGYEEEVTPPPTVSRRGRGTATGTPRGKAAAGPSTPLARKAVTGKIASPPEAKQENSSFDSPPVNGVETPNAATGVADHDDPATPLAHKIESGHNTGPQSLHSDLSNSTAQTQLPQSKETGPSAPKIMLRFTRPAPLPPAELASLPSPITPLPPSHSSMYPLPPHMSAPSDHQQQHQQLSIGQHLAYREGSASTSASEDYLSAREVRSETSGQGTSANASSGTASTSPEPQLPGEFTGP